MRNLKSRGPSSVQAKGFRAKIITILFANVELHQEKKKNKNKNKNKNKKNIKKNVKRCRDPPKTMETRRDQRVYKFNITQHHDPYISCFVIVNHLSQLPHLNTSQIK